MYHSILNSILRLLAYPRLSAPLNSGGLIARKGSTSSICPHSSASGKMARASRSTSQSKPATPKKPQSTQQRPSRTRNNKKSKYFEPDSDEDDSPFEDAEPDPTSESESLSETDEDEPPKKKSKITPQKASSKTTPKKTAPKSRLSKGGKEVSEDEEPWETFIAKEDTPEVGDVPYRDETIHPNTLQFLKGNFH